MNTKQDEVTGINDDDNAVDWNLVRRLFVKEYPVDRFSVSGEYKFSAQKMANLDKNDQLSDEGETLGHGKQTIIPRMLFPPKTKGKTNVSKATAGKGFPQIKKDSC